MDELFALSNADVRELLEIIKSSHFNQKRATCWPCSTRLLASNVYAKIEKAVEAHLGRPVYVVFDELFTPSGSGDSFQLWHKDVEDADFAGGCFNVWIPLYTGAEEVEGLQLLASDELNAYDRAEGHGSSVLPFPIGDNELLLMKQSSMETKVIDLTKVEIERKKASLFHVYLLDSSRFHAAVKTESFQLRFGIKFAVSPFETFRSGSLDIMAFAYAANLLREADASLPSRPKEWHYETVKFLDEHLSARFNESDPRSATLYRCLIEHIERRLPAS